jgi:hypothetical protein
VETTFSEPHALVANAAISTNPSKKDLVLVTGVIVAVVAVVMPRVIVPGVVLGVVTVVVT